MEKDAAKPKKNRVVWMGWGAAVIVFALVVAVLVACRMARKTEKPTAIAFGDSIFATLRWGDSAVELLSKKRGETIVNAAFGGTAMAKTGAEKRWDDDWNYFSMDSLIDSVIAQDFSPQRQTKISGYATEYFPELVERLDRMNFGKLSLLLLEYGMNDYQLGTPLENPQDPLDEYTFAGALRLVLGKAKKEFPNCRIVLVSPTYSWYISYEKNCEEKDFGGGLLEDYVKVEERIAKEYGVEFIDLYHDLYEHESFADWETYTVDGVHPNELGCERIAERIASSLEEHP